VGRQAKQENRPTSFWLSRVPGRLSPVIVGVRPHTSQVGDGVSWSLPRVLWGRAMFPKASLIGVALLAIIPSQSQAHDIYGDLKNRGGVSCCNGNDCRPAPYRIVGGSVQMLVDGTWFVISNDLVDYRALEGDTGETNGGHWCGRHTVGMSWDYLNTFCAFLPPGWTLATPVRVQRARERDRGLGLGTIARACGSEHGHQPDGPGDAAECRNG
jgi:hypothetical protein